MKNNLAYINGMTLRTIRERRGVSSKFLCNKVRIKPEQLELWEQCAGTDYPTMKQAEKISDVLLYPLAGLYLSPNNVPIERIPSLINKRRVCDMDQSDDSELNLIVAELMQIRSDAIAIASESGLVINEFSAFDLANDILAAASELRIWIDFSLAQQMNARSSRQLFLGLRKRLEDRGILVLMFDKLRVEELRGMALGYDQLPIIGINSRDRWPAKCFSLLHELVHLFLRHSTICNQIGIEADDAEEVYCNAVAGEFLFPRSCASGAVFDGLDPHDVEALNKVALRYNVSRDVVARRMRDCGVLSKGEYEELLDLFARELAEENERRKRSREGGAELKFFQDYERTIADKHGSLYCEIISHGLSTGLLGERDVCSALNVSAERLEKVFVEAFK